MAKTSIAWATDTWNPIIGCSKTSPGCANCYAEKMAARLAWMRQDNYGQVVTDSKTWTGKTRFIESALTQPLHWRKPRRIFVCSMSDLFHESTPDEQIDRVFAVMALCPQHTFLVLTKRPARMREYLSSVDTVKRIFGVGRDALSAGNPSVAFSVMVQNICSRHEPIAWPLPNVHLGVSCEDQQRADERIPHLLATAAAVRFLSVEPLMGAVKLQEHIGHERYGNIPGHCVDIDVQTWHAAGEKCRNCGWGYPNDPDRPGSNPRIHQVIIGGESGPKARPCNVEWIRSIVGQCKAAGVAAFVKQMGAYVTSDNVNCDDWPEDTAFTGEGTGFAAARVRLINPKGGEPLEWPEDLRVREYPTT